MTNVRNVEFAIAVKVHAIGDIPCRLPDLHLTADTDHFMFADKNVRVRQILTDWLAEYMPVR